MTTRSARVARTALALSASVLFLAGCVGTPEPVATTTSATASDAAQSPAPVVTSTPTADADAEPTCETLIPSSVVDEFASHKWTAKQDVFRVGSLTIDDGLECVWGDYSVASDHVQVFGWAPISAADAATARSELLATGWQRIDDASGNFITENPDTAVSTDEDGYGMTYQFGDGWILLADTKQGLLLIERPEG